MPSPTRSRSRAAPLAAAIILFSACATPTPFQPISTHSKTSGGYSEQRILPDRYRVTFAGNSFTSRSMVENYLLLRAAQLTIQNGFDGFTMVTRATDPTTSTTVSRDPFSFGFGGYWGPSWRYNRGGFGWNSWDPWVGGPFWADNVDVQTVTSYEASAEIIMYRGSGRDDPASFDAHQVVASLSAIAMVPG